MKYYNINFRKIKFFVMFMKNRFMINRRTLILFLIKNIFSKEYPKNYIKMRFFNFYISQFYLHFIHKQTKYFNSGFIKFEILKHL